MATTLAGVSRRAYVVLVGIAATMGILALVTALSLGKSMRDPEGFLGPAWVRFPMLIFAAFLLDVLPRTLWLSRLHPKRMPRIVADRVREHWGKERIILVVLGITCFYTTYVSYRNLKSFLPEVRPGVTFDRELHLLDRTLFFGHEPATVLHDLLGTSFTAHLLSFIYLWFLPMVPLALTGWLIWSRNLSYGYWFATSQCIAWTIGTASYYALPTVGPGFEYPWLVQPPALAHTPTTDLMEALKIQRDNFNYDLIPGAMQGVAGFASLHVGITVLVALLAQYTLRNRFVHWVLWINVVLTMFATLYFGWHYIADDIAGVVLALVSFYLGGLASGQVFDRHGMSSHPTTMDSKIPRKHPKAGAEPTSGDTQAAVTDPD